jgi:Protein of unknown function (DUF2844)
MRALFVFTCCIIASVGAHASLGGAPSQFPAATGATAVQARQLAASPGAPGNTSYNVRETTLEGGTVVREFTGADGQVFAVSWNGPFLPDLRSLLGSRFADYTAAQADSRARGRGQPRVNDGDLVIESNGHMRSYSGRAWLIKALPAGFSTDAIQ